MNTAQKTQFLSDALNWAVIEQQWKLEAPDFIDRLFLIIAPMSNFEIGKEDISAHLKEQQPCL